MDPKFVNKVFRLFLIFSFLLGAISVPHQNAKAEEPVPHIVAFPDSSWVQASGWLEGATITMYIDDPETPQPVDFSAQAIVGPNPENPAEQVAGFNSWGGFVLKAGQVITMTDGINPSVTYTVGQLQVTSIDVVNDTVSGFATPGSRVEMCVIVQNQCFASRVTMVDNPGSGSWALDYRVGEPPVDLQLGVSGVISETDARGNWTGANWSTPFFTAFPYGDQISAERWPLGATITISIDRPSTPLSPDFSTTQVAVRDNGRLYNSGGGFNYPSPYNFTAGDTITLTDGVTTKSLVVSPVHITSIDLENNRVTGTTDPLRTMWAFDNNVMLVFQSGPDGSWVADFTGKTVLQLENAGGIKVLDADGDMTHVDMEMDVREPGPYIHAAPNQYFVYAYDWTDGALVHMDVARSGSTIFSSDATVGPGAGNPGFPIFPGHVAAYFNLANPQFDLLPGDVITLTGGGINKSMVVSALNVTEVNEITDTVSGIADVGHLVDIGACDGPNLRVMPAPDGTWTANFAPYDIKAGACGGTIQSDADGNITQQGWGIPPLPNPTVAARANYDSVEGYQWPMGATVTISIDDPATPGVNPDFSGQAVVGIASWDPNQTWFNLGFGVEYDLKPGDIITVSDTETIRTLAVTNPAFVDVNPYTDILTGKAAPNSQVSVDACGNSGCFSRQKTASPDGDVLVNFSIPGDFDWEQGTIDLQPGNWIDLSEYDSAGNATRAGRLVGSSISGTVYAVDATPGNEAGGVMIEACSADPVFCRTALTNTRGQYEVSGLSAGIYNLRAFPSGQNLPGYLGPLAISYDQVISGQDVTIPAQPLPPPPHAVEPAHTGGGTLSVFWMDTLTLSSSGCTNGAASFALSVEEDGYTASGAMAETPAGSGSYTTSIPALYPHHGVVHITYTLTCPGGSITQTGFFIYVDPSGTVIDTLGAPVSGATVTLLVADNPDGPFEVAPDGSNFMSPSNRSNPMTTAANGEFGWDVVAGFYKLRAEKPGCVSPDDPSQAFVESAVLTIPPPVTGLVLILKCPPVNTPPTSVVITAPLNPVQIGQFISAQVAFTDPDAGDTHTITWDWGDGTTSIGTAAYATHFYTHAGVYMINATVKDAAGASAGASFSYIVIYDPTGGFVTGGGWILNPTTGSKINFGFNPKYQKDSAIPKGETEVKLEGLKFNSTSHDWLVISGAKAQFKGSGTINGSGNYGFLITVIDGKVAGGVDRIRIKIWNKASGEVIYDNQPGATDSADPTAAIQGGSVTVHKPK